MLFFVRIVILRIFSFVKFEEFKRKKICLKEDFFMKFRFIIFFVILLMLLVGFCILVFIILIECIVIFIIVIFLVEFVE